MKGMRWLWATKNRDESVPGSVLTYLISSQGIPRFIPQNPGSFPSQYQQVVLEPQISSGRFINGVLILASKVQRYLNIETGT